MRRVLASEGLKLRGTWIWPLVLLGPLGVVGLTALRYSHGGPVVTGAPAWNWALLIQNTAHLLMPALVLGVAVLALLVAGVEHDGQAWKQLLAAPVPAGQIYLAKWLWLEGLLAASATLAVAGTLGLGLALGLGGPIPWGHVLLAVYYPYLAATGIVAIQLLVSVLLPGAVALSLGVLGMIASGLADALAPDAIARSAHWAPLLPVPWVYPALSAINHAAVLHLQFPYVLDGLVVGAVVTALGCRAVARLGGN